jgi:hypothetical protein
MARMFAAFFAVMLFAAPAYAGSSLAIRAGETVTLTLSDDGFAVTDRRPAPPMSVFEAYSLRHVLSVKVPEDATVLPPMPIMREDVPVPPPPHTPGLVRITFREVPGGAEGQHAFLTIENGYNRSFRYRAVMHRGTRSSPTDVCEIMPNKPGFEHWPFEIEWLELSEVRLEAPLEDRIRCQ